MEEENPWLIPGLFQGFNVNSDGERVETLRSMEQYYVRRIQRQKEEKERLKETIENQFKIIEQMNIKNDEIKANEPKEIEKTDDGDYEKYSKLETDYYSMVLMQAADFEQYFYHFPLVYSLLIDRNFSINIDEIGKTIQQFPTKKRNNFYHEFFRDMRETVEISHTTHKILSTTSELQLAEVIGENFPRYFGFQRVMIFRYNKEENTLSIIKQRLAMSYKTSGGLVEQAAKTGSRFYISRASKTAGSDDILILGESSDMWVVPIIDMPIILIFYNKTEEINSKKDLLVTLYSKIITQAYSIFSLRTALENRINDYRGTSDIIIKLSTVGDMKNFLKILQRSLESLFDCEGVRLFRLRRNRSSLTKYGSDKQYNKIVPIGTGIVSNVIIELESIIVEEPELSINFDPATDRMENDIQTKSLMVVPVFKGERVKWIIAMYNKKGRKSFGKADKFSMKFFAKSLNSLISSVLITSNVNRQMSDSSRVIKDVEKQLLFISNIKDLCDLNQISKSAIKELDKLISYNDATIYTANFNIMRLDGTGSDANYSSVISQRDQDPKMEFMLTQTISMYANKIMFCPLINDQGRTNGIFVMQSTKQDNRSKVNMNSFLKTPYQIRQSLQSNTVKKLSGLAQHQLALHTKMIPSRIRSIVTAWSSILSTLVTASKEQERLLMILSSIKRFSETSTDLSPTFNFMYTSMLCSAFSLYPEKSFKLILANESEMQFSRMIITGIQSKSFIQIKGVMKKKEDPFKKPEEMLMYNTNEMDSFSLDECYILPVLVDIAIRSGVAEFLGLNEDETSALIRKARSYTKTNGFRSWRMTFDHVQFAFFLISSMGIMKRLTDPQKAALFLFFLCYYAEPFETNQRSLIEVGENKASVCAFVICDAIGNLPERKQISLMDCITKLDKIDLLESAGTSFIPLLIAIITKFSYCMRKEDVSVKLCNMRFKEELVDDSPEMVEEIGKSILDYENRTILQTVLGELCRLGYQIDSIRKILAENMAVLTKFVI